MKQAIILVSGGLDSYVLAHSLRKENGTKILLLFFDYAQKSLVQELACVKSLAKEIDSKLKIIKLPFLGKLSTSLLNKKNQTGEEEIIKWYVPFRNTMFISAALALAESIFLKTSLNYDIYLGIKYEGNLRFKDTTPDFIIQMNQLSKTVAEKGKYSIKAPFLDKDKEEVLELAKNLRLNLENTFSCYTPPKSPSLIHCGKCAGCLSRKKAFRFSKSQIEDPSIYLE